MVRQPCTPTLTSSCPAWRHDALPALRHTSDQRQTAGRRFTNPNSKTRPALRLRLRHPCHRRSLDAGLLLFILTTWTTPAGILVHVARLNTLNTILGIASSHWVCARGRCPVESRWTTCPETARLEFHHCRTTLSSNHHLQPR